ncbi:MAG: T9SS type A sorting domain-containing protein [Bacteroidota bacterium]
MLSAQPFNRAIPPQRHFSKTAELQNIYGVQNAANSGLNNNARLGSNVQPGGSNRTGSVASTFGWRKIEEHSHKNGFFDDFTTSGYIPDTLLWLRGGGATINRRSADSPPTQNTMVFDNFDGRGMPYSESLLNNGGGDTLTSSTIASMDRFSTAIKSNLYMSFFWQAGGLQPQSEPDLTDSLVLQTWSSVDSTWLSIWRAFGQGTFMDFKYEIFKLDTNRLENFAFRFINYGSRTGVSYDTWHVDYININYTADGDFSRRLLTVNPGGVRDVFIHKAAPSMLAQYTAKPYNQALYGDTNQFQRVNAALVKHFRQNTDSLSEVSFGTKVSLRNPFNGREYYTRTATDKIGFEGTFSLEIITPFRTMNSFLRSAGRPFPLEAKFAVSDTGQANHIQSNDTITTITHLANFYAYDDGTAELSRSVGGNNAWFAYRFDVDTVDTLTHIAVYFPRTWQNARPDDSLATALNFRLAVLKNVAEGGTINYNLDGDILRRQDVEVGFDDAGENNGYQVYRLNRPLTVHHGPIYIGYQQGIGLENTLEVGLDVNTNSHGRGFYNYSGTWQADTGHWALMIRPWFGEKPYTITALKPQDAELQQVSLYPNPSSGSFTVSGKVQLITVCDLSGKVLFEKISPAADSSNTLSADTEGLPAGMYLVKCLTKSGALKVLKLLVK